MHGMTKIIVLLSLLVAFAGCDRNGDDGEEEASDCPEGVMTVDGEPVVFQSAFGFHQNGSYALQLYNHQDMTCEIILAMEPRVLPDGEIDLRMADMFGGLVATGSDHVGAEGLELEAEPQAAGELLAYCVRDSVQIGENITVVGRFTGQFCGFVE